MFIKSLELNNFKRFKHLFLEFPSDITIIKGPNEQGKSSIVQALIAALFYDPAKSNESIKSLKAWGSDKLYTLNLAFEAGGEDYVLEKDFENKNILLKNQATGEEINEYKEIAKKLTRLGGYQTPELFFNTACVKQGELAVLDKKQTITEALQDVVSGGGSSISLNSIFKRIEKSQDDLKRGRDRGLAKNPGTLLRLGNEIDERTKYLEEKKRVFEEEDKSRQRLGALRKERDGTQKKFEIKESVFKANVAYFEIQKILDGLNAEYDKARRKSLFIDDLDARRGKLKKKVDPLAHFAKIDPKPFLDIRREIERYEDQIVEFENKIDSMSRKGLKSKWFVSQPYILLGGALLAFGALGLFVDRIFFLSWALFGILSFWFVFSRAIFSKIVKRTVMRERNKIEKQREKKLRELKNKLKSIKVESIEEIDRNKDRLRETLSKIEVIDSKIEGLLGEETAKQFSERKGELAKRIGIEESKITKEQVHQPPTREEQAGLEREISGLKKDFQDGDREITGIEAMLSASVATHDEIVRLEEKIFFLKEELGTAQKKERVLAVLSEVLQEAQQKTFSSTRKVLEQYIGEFISEITEGKYSKISIGNAMKIKVFSAEKGEEIEPEGNLSEGATEQLYLVSRFALISLLYPQAARPLVVLDDPFGSFDARRRARTRHIAKRLSEKFQILLLTCSDEYDKWGKVIVLK